MDVIEAGRKGGLSSLKKFGREFYVRIGQKGQTNMRSQYPDMAREWGKRGGRPRKSNPNNMGKCANFNIKGGTDPP